MTRNLPIFSIVVLLAGYTWVPVLAADETSLVSPADLDRAIADRLANEHESREALRQLLQQVQEAAFARGLTIDLRRAESAVAALEGEELEALAAQAHALQTQLAGGHNGSPPFLWPSLILLAAIIAILALLAVSVF